MDSSLVTMVLGKVIEEAKRVFADKSATMETSPLKDILLKVEQADLSDLKNLDFSKLLGGGGLGSVVGSIGGMLLGGLLGGDKKEDSAEKVYSEAEDMQSKLASLGKEEGIAPERGRIVDVLGKALSFLSSCRQA